MTQLGSIPKESIDTISAIENEVGVILSKINKNKLK
jgi:hypothetical protein